MHIKKHPFRLIARVGNLHFQPGRLLVVFKSDIFYDSIAVDEGVTMEDVTVVRIKWILGNNTYGIIFALKNENNILEGR